VGALLKARFEAEGMRVLTSTQAISFQANSATLESVSGKTEIAFDRVLVALGRKANVSGFGLEELGVKLRSDGSIESDSFLRTSIPGIYACGDVTGPYQFTHFAALSGSAVALNALFRPIRLRANWDVFPWAMYTDPEVARVGFNELEAKRAGIEFEITQYDMAKLDRAITESENYGFVKVVTLKGSDKILGATIVGVHAGEMIQEFTIAMKFGLGLKKILSITHPYPTFMEANKFVAGNWARAHSPAWALKLLSRFHGLRRNTGI
jgi:pyruvate/2-oxoglutarate dehydrogenase complex dihydrolipoamide dehydrogenase (E3) component